jgi:hypothetical protein
LLPLADDSAQKFSTPRLDREMRAAGKIARNRQEAL